MHQTIAFIGGGNMAGALIGGLIRQGWPVADILVVEPDEAQRARLHEAHGLVALRGPEPTLGRAQVFLWAVKPQQLREAVRANAPHMGEALHLSIAAGIRAADLARWLGTRRVIRAMPNTPALVGAGLTGLAALDGAGEADRALATRLMEAVGTTLWVDSDAELDAVTAVSGSGPAYVFYFIEALQAAAVQQGFSPSNARELALRTFHGAVQQACQSVEPPQVLRERVTSKGGTTHAAITVLEQRAVRAAIEDAVGAAASRAASLAEEFGRA